MGADQVGRSTVPGQRGLVVFCSHSIHDPLVSTLMLDYVMRLQGSRPDRDVLFFTEEPGSRQGSAALMKELALKRIEWVPVQYDHREPFQWWRKMRNGVVMLRRCYRFKKSHPDSAVLGFLGIAGAYALLVKELLGFNKGVTFCFEPHSLYMREVGVWPKWGAKYLFTNWMERLQIRRMDVLVVPTSAGLEQARSFGRSASTPLLGITIDVQACSFDEEARTKLRRIHGSGEDTVFIYVGKFGGIYHTVDQYMEFVCRLLEALPTARSVIVTHAEWRELLEQHPRRASLGRRLVLMDPVPPAELRLVLSSADIGVVAIPPTPSQAFRTPVKTAHYWAAGLPILIPKGVSDDGKLAERHGTGILVDDLPSAAMGELVQKVAEFRAMDPKALRERCIDCAMRYRDTSLSVELLKDILQ